MSYAVPPRNFSAAFFSGALQPALSFLLAFAVLFAASRWQEQPPLPDEISAEETAAEISAAAEEETAGDFTAEPVAAITLPEDAIAGPPPPPAEESFLEYRIRRGDTMENILRATNADDDMRAALLNPKLKTHRKLRIKDAVYFKLDAGGKLKELLYKTSPDYYLTAGRAADGAAWAREDAPQLQKTRRAKSNRIESSLFAAAEAAQMTDAAINALIEVLETQIDFYRDVRAGDSFRVIYEELLDDYGEPIQTEEVLAFQYNSTKRARPRVIRGVLNPADGQYYTPEGESLSRAFLPAPLKYKRISSKFSRRRLHPVLKKYRPHRGIDYAAPTGTPIRATADGVVSKVARQRGYGNVVFIKHFNIYTTVYAHLSRFARGVKRGRAVKQGEVIGYVGQTGLATGPHLHYEFRVRGKHKDPLSVDFPRQLPPLAGGKLAAFQKYSAPLVAELEALS